MKISILLIVNAFFISLPMFCEEYQSVTEITKQDLRPDSTVVCLLDGKRIPYKMAIQKAVASEITWVTGTSNPREAIRYFGITGKNGLFVFTTKKEEEVKDEK